MISYLVVPRSILGHFDIEAASLTKCALSFLIQRFLAAYEWGWAHPSLLNASVRFQPWTFQTGVERLSHCTSLSCCKYAEYTVNCVVAKNIWWKMTIHLGKNIFVEAVKLIRLYSVSCLCSEKHLLVFCYPLSQACCFHAIGSNISCYHLFAALLISFFYTNTLPLTVFDINFYIRYSFVYRYSIL